MTQLKTVAYSRRGVQFKTDLTPAKQAEVKASELKCSDPKKCNATGVAWLFDVVHTPVPAGKKLKKQRLIDEILADRPVIVMWDYTNADRTGNLPTSTHYLIITGYDDETDQFRVFDPWLGYVQAPDEPDVHEHYISYEGYVDPHVSLGHHIKAAHESDCYDLRRPAPGAEQLMAPDQDFDPLVEAEPVVLETTDFDEILRLEHDIQAIAHRRIVYAHDGRRLSAPKRAAEAFPIVALTTRQIFDADASAHRLLIQRSWALIAPVVTGTDRKVVDSFQMYRSGGKWQEGGYSNSRIAKLMLKAAERLRREVGAKGRIYLVSIPEQVMFFAASGEGEAAHLISLDADATGPVLTGKQALHSVLEFVQMRRESAKDRDPAPLR